MNSISLIVFAFLLSLASCQQNIVTYKNYLIKFNKSYPTNSTVQVRKAIFEENFKALLQKQKKSNPPYLSKQTKFLDWTPSELKKLLTKVPQIINVSPEKEVRVSSMIKVRGLTPESLNWTALGKVTPAKDQGECGSCFSFSTVGLAQSYFLITQNKTTDLSEQYTLQCNPDGMNCGGGDPVNMLQFAIDNGLPNETTYPYNPNIGHFPICQTTNKTYLPDNTGVVMSQMATPDDVVNMLQNGPVISLFSVYDIDSFKAYMSGPYTGCPLNDQLPISSLNHAVLVVGYNANNFIAKNSWGKDWGENGSFLVPKNQSCGIGIFNVQLATCQKGYFYNRPTTPNMYGYLNDIGSLSCLPCDPSCETCKNNLTCTSCHPEQQLVLLNGACVPQCPIVTTVLSGLCVCSGGNYFANGQCKQCNSYCATCDNSTICKTCKPGLYKNLLDGQCYRTCPVNTQTVNSSFYFCTCLNRTFREPTNNTCIPCINGCQYCTNSHSCERCSIGTLTYDKTACIECQNQNCRNCSTGLCTACEIGYLLDAYTFKCTVQCEQSWMIERNGICYCEGQYDSIQKVCRFPCPKECNNSCLDKNQCMLCIPGYYKDKNGSCLICTDPCLACENASTTCTLCKNGSYLVNNTCKMCSDNCTNCQDIGTCLTCFNGFDLRNGSCYCSGGAYSYNGSCISTCPWGMTGVNSKCQCTPPTYEVQGLCLNCAVLCAKCNDTSSCQMCKPRSFLINNTCSCEAGYYIAGNDCFPCEASCSTCATKNICLSCKPTYKKYQSTCCAIGKFFNSIKKTCDTCSANCSDCEQNGCTACKQNYILNQTTCVCNQTFYYNLAVNDCIACPSPCYTCTASTACKSCLNPFILTNSSCKCPKGMYQINAQCFNCNASCKECASSSMCSDCNDGYYLSGANCLPCSVGCFRCPGSICTNCTTPFILINGSCIRTSCPANCHSCVTLGTILTCQKCNDYYQLTSKQTCQTISNIDWQVTNLQNPSSIPINSTINTTVPCMNIFSQNQTFSFSFPVLGNTTSIIVNTFSIAYCGNIVLTIAPSNITNGYVSMSKSSQDGIYPNRFASINYSIYDCTKTQKLIWSLTLFENGTNYAILQTGPVVGSSNTLSISTPGTLRATDSSYQVGNSSNKLIMGGYTCPLDNCNLCWPNSNQCTYCNSGYLIQNGKCQTQCSSGYTAYNNYICLNTSSNNTVYPNRTNNNSNNNNNSKDGGSSTGVAVGVGVGVGVGVPALIAAIIGIWCCCRRNNLDNAAIVGSQVTMVPDTNRIMYQQQPVFAPPSAHSMPSTQSPYSMNFLPPPQLEPFQYQTYPAPFTQQQQIFIMPPMNPNYTITLPNALPAVPPPPPHHGYREPVMYDPNNRSLQVSRALSLYKN